MKKRSELKIVIVDDIEKKTDYIDCYLFEQKIYEVDYFTCMNPALKYIIENKNEISGIILDLGFCTYEDSNDWNQYKGLDLAEKLLKKNINIPILINSSTEVLTRKIPPSVFGQMFTTNDTETLEKFITFLELKEP